MDKETKAEIDRINGELGQIREQIVAIWQMLNREGASVTRHIGLLYDNIASSDEKVAALLEAVFPKLATTQQQVADILNPKPKD